MGIPEGLSGGVNDAGANNNMEDNSNDILDPAWTNPGSEMWYLPPGPAFFQNMENSSVAMTAEGVNVGGLDLLEYMAMDSLDQANFNVMGANSY
jgi:hypothetical protein